MKDIICLVFVLAMLAGTCICSRCRDVFLQRVRVFPAQLTPGCVGCPGGPGSPG